MFTEFTDAGSSEDNSWIFCWIYQYWVIMMLGQCFMMDHDVYIVIFVGCFFPVDGFCHRTEIEKTPHGHEYHPKCLIFPPKKLEFCLRV